MTDAAVRKLAIFLPSLDGGGAERINVNLAVGAANRGISVDLVLSRAVGPYLGDVPDSVRVIDLGASRVARSMPALVRYLRRARPEAMLTAISHANVVGLWARRLAGTPTRVVVAEHDTLSLVTEEATRRRARLMPLFIRRSYPRADAIVAVSAGVADDLAAATGIRRSSISVVYNPVVTPEVVAAAKAPAPHPWLEPDEPPVVVAIGRLAPKKDFPLLLRAFAGALEKVPARLIVLGEGPQRAELERQVETLGLEASVAMPGFVDNPYAFLGHATLFVLSSRWEGLPTVLIEAMFCGTPVVATDCRSGPREILSDGRFGTLVPVGDDEALAKAIVEGLLGAIPAPPFESWEPFVLESVVDQYLALALPER